MSGAFVHDSWSIWRGITLGRKITTGSQTFEASIHEICGHLKYTQWCLCILYCIYIRVMSSLFNCCHLCLLVKCKTNCFSCLIITYLLLVFGHLNSDIWGDQWSFEVGVKIHNVIYFLSTHLLFSKKFDFDFRNPSKCLKSVNSQMSLAFFENLLISLCQPLM